MCYNFPVRRECVNFFPPTNQKRRTVNPMPRKKTKSGSAPSPARKVVSSDEVWASINAMSAKVQEVSEVVYALQEGDEKTRKRIEEAEEARGRAAEAMFRKALPAVLKKAGMKVDHVEPNRLRLEDREYDFVARNGKANFVGEVKVRFKAKHLSQLRGLLAKFREDYPEKAGDRPVYGVVCGMVVDDDAADIARKEGLLVVEGRTKAKLRVKPDKIRDYAGH